MRIAAGLRPRPSWAPLDGANGAVAHRRRNMLAWRGERDDRDLRPVVAPRWGQGNRRHRARRGRALGPLRARRAGAQRRGVRGVRIRPPRPRAVDRLPRGHGREHRPGGLRHGRAVRGREAAVGQGVPARALDGDDLRPSRRDRDAGRDIGGAHPVGHRARARTRRCRVAGQRGAASGDGDLTRSGRREGLQGRPARVRGAPRLRSPRRPRRLREGDATRSARSRSRCSSCTGRPTS